MSIGLVGRKCGMTRLFDEQGNSTPVSVVHVNSNYITQLKSTDVDGYNAIQVSYDQQKPSRVNKPKSGHYAKAGVAPGRGLKEFRLTDKELQQFELGQQLDVAIFEEGQVVDVTGTSKGKGFAGGVKRHNFKMQDATHGNSVSHRAIGSTGQCQTPGRVFKGKKMPGQMGNVTNTTQGLKIVKVDVEKGLLLIKGSITGAPGGVVVVKPSLKSKRGS